MTTLPSISIAGSGRMAMALARAFQHAGVKVDMVYARNEASFSTIEKNGVRLTKLKPDTIVESDVLFLAVSDQAIGEVSCMFRTPKVGIIAHTSGAENLDCLTDAMKNGWKPASFHPIQTVTESAPEDVFRDVTVSILAGADETQTLAILAKKVGAIPLPVSESDKIRLHIAAVFLSNYVTSLTESAGNILSKGDINPEKTTSIFGPLLRNAVDQLLNMGPDKALTGPVSRADAKTIRLHLAQLEKDGADNLRRLYVDLGRQALNVAVRDNRFSVSQADEIKHILR